MNRSVLCLPVFAALAACGAGAAPAGPQPEPGATSAAISEADVQLRLSILSDDSMAGRETGRPGAEAAARYLASEMSRLGLRPAGDDGTFLQRVPLERSLRRADADVVLEGTRSTLTREDILPVSGLGGLPNSPRADGSGALLYAGHLVDPEIGNDEITLDQIQNAVIMVRLGLPEGVDPEAAAPRMAIGAAFGPASPASAILLVAEEAEEEFWDYAAEIASKGEVTLRNGDSDAPAGSPPPFFLISAELAERILGGSLEGARTPRAGLGSFEYRVSETVSAVDGWNVAAVVPGSDPRRAQEYVALGAHYDHIGIGTPVDGDSIYNGADDNGTGTTALLEVAEALAYLPVDQRPDRSTLFVWNTAEESGLLGSEYFTDHPTVTRSGIVAHINMDMVGRNSPDSISLVGSRRIASGFGDLVEEVNARQDPPFLLDYSLDVPGHPEQIYCRSDHYNYARYGIPIVFFTTGLHDDYHAPSDEIDLISFSKVARVARLTYDIAMEVGNRAERPMVDQAVPPLGTPCEG